MIHAGYDWQDDTHWAAASARHAAVTAARDEFEAKSSDAWRHHVDDSAQVDPSKAGAEDAATLAIAKAITAEAGAEYRRAIDAADNAFAAIVIAH